MDDKVSVIIPIYNTEKYLNRCIESVLNQKHNNIELILVDDESPDNCPAMCDEWAKKDDRIKVIHKKNAGLGMARNSGLDIASGDYITFLDSDDYLHENTFKKALKSINDNDTDICCYACTNVYGDKKLYPDIRGACGVYRDKEIVDRFLVNSIAANEYEQERHGIGISACAIVYKAYIFRDFDLRFLSEREYINEDLAFRIALCKHIKSAVIIPQPFYFYYHNSGTLSTSYRADRLSASIKMYEKVKEDIIPLNSAELEKRCKRHFMVNLLVCLKHEILFARKNGYLKAFKNLKSICKNKTVQEILKSYPIDKLPKKQKALFYAVKYRLASAVWVLCKIKQMTNNKKIN